MNMHSASTLSSLCITRGTRPTCVPWASLASPNDLTFLEYWDILGFLGVCVHLDFHTCLGSQKVRELKEVEETMSSNVLPL